MELKSTVLEAGSEATIQGFVKFDLGNVHVPGMGSIHVKSKYPRLKPKFEREHVENSTVETFCADLLKWVNKKFETTGREKYFKELVMACVLFCLYTSPQLKLYSEEMDFNFKLTFWLWYNDDVIEAAIHNKNGCKALKLGTDQIQSILTGNYDNNPKPEFKDVPNYPTFRNLFYALLEWHNMCRDRLPEYERLAKNFVHSLTTYFSALRWFCVDQIDGRYSEESFKTYRKVVAFFDGIANAIALIRGVKLTDEMWNSVTMKRLLEISNVLGGYANDVLGMKKEFKNVQERDNLIVFMVLEKKIPLEVAVQQVCDLLASELADYVLLKQVILHEFDYDENLIRYLDILDSLIDGHNVIYEESTRHRAVGSVSLTR